MVNVGALPVVDTTGKTQDPNEGGAIVPHLASLKESPGIRVLLIDDNPDFLKAAVDFLRRRQELVLVGATDGGEQALAQAPILKPQVILIDLELPGLADLKTIPRLRRILPGVGIVALTLLDSRAYRKAALDAGAHAVVSKARLVSDLLPAIHRLRPVREPAYSTEPMADDLAQRHCLP